MASDGGISMYTYPRLLETEYEVPLPDSMYKMQNIQGNTFFKNGPDMAALNVKNAENDAVSHLIKKQERFLSDLDYLKNEIDRLAKKAGVSPEMLEKSEKHESSRTTSMKSSDLKKENLQKSHKDIDIVITAKPSDPPLSAFILFNLLKQRGLQISSAMHVHSSLKQNQNMPSNYQHCIGVKDSIIQPHNGLTLTFIWKEENFWPSLLVSPRLQTPIRGDANIARYLCRKFAADLFEGLDEDAIFLIDHWTSVATIQIQNGTQEQTKKAISMLEKRLSSNKYLASDDLTLADIIVWSAISRSNLTKSLTGNAKKWFLNCSKEFDSVSSHFSKT